jgi:hypothetical protein
MRSRRRSLRALAMIATSFVGLAVLPSAAQAYIVARRTVVRPGGFGVGVGLGVATGVAVGAAVGAARRPVVVAPGGLGYYGAPGYYAPPPAYYAPPRAYYAPPPPAYYW